MNDYVFNRCCSEPAYRTDDEAREHVAKMLQGLSILDSESETLPAFRCHVDPWLLPIVSDGTGSLNVSLGEVVNSLYGTAEHDVAVYFDALVRMVPSDAEFGDEMVNAVLRITPQAAVEEHEACFDSVKAAAFDVALCVVSHSVLTSLPRNDLWSFNRLAFKHGVDKFFVDHVSLPEHGEAIKARRIAGIRGQLTARSFWTLKDAAFPNLRFGVDVEGQIKGFSAELLPLAFKRLAGLDSRAKIWRESDSPEFPDGVTEITPETPATMKRYGEERNFRGYDGAVRTFELHMWVDGLHRIHLFLHDESKTVEVGYIGRHLPTMQHRT
jgi:hypothetical protein